MPSCAIDAATDYRDPARFAQHGGRHPANPDGFDQAWGWLFQAATLALVALIAFRPQGAGRWQPTLGSTIWSGKLPAIFFYLRQNAVKIGAAIRRRSNSGWLVNTPLFYLFCIDRTNKIC